jgi:pimeloyl-ACP methyl ester carboxylesterase
MPHLRVNGTTLYYEDSGGTGEAVVFSHGLLFSADMFEAQVRALAPRYRCIRYDHRGQGRSADPGGRLHDIEDVTNDAESLIRALGVAPCHFVGLSMGGFVGMRLAARHPELLRTLTLLETSADPEPEENVPRYRLLALVSRWIGLRAVIGRVMPILFSRSFLADPSRAAERALWRNRLASNRRSIVRAVHGVIERRGVAGELPLVRVPTLVIVGEEDVATVPAKAERIHALIPGSALVRIAGAGHSSCIEQPERVNEELGSFLASVER